MAVSFARPEQGLGHQRPMPQTPPPDGLQEWTTLREGAVGLPDRPEYESPIEVRVIDPTEFDGVEGLKSERQVWIRPRGKLPDDPALHTATLVYATDWTLLSTVLRATGRTPGMKIMGASLDHAVWLHHPIRFDDWLLFTSQSPISHAARGLIFGALYRRDGVQLASVAQEALVRERPSES
jgi:acyl-CoA thioesterase-2